MNKDDLLTIGQVASAHGVRGEVNLILLTDFPERVARLTKVYLTSGTEVRGPFAVEAARRSGSRAILKLAEVSTREEAAALQGWEVAVSKTEAVKLPPGRYYYYQVVGLPVYTTDGEYVGRVRRIIDLPSNDVYVVEDEGGREILLPATHEVIKEINLADQRMVVQLLPGLR